MSIHHLTASGSATAGPVYTILNASFAPTNGRTAVLLVYPLGIVDEPPTVSGAWTNWERVLAEQPILGDPGFRIYLFLGRGEVTDEAIEISFGGSPNLFYCRWALEEADDVADANALVQWNFNIGSTGDAVAALSPARTRSYLMTGLLIEDHDGVGVSPSGWTTLTDNEAAWAEYAHPLHTQWRDTSDTSPDAVIEWLFTPGIGGNPENYGWTFLAFELAAAANTPVDDQNVNVTRALGVATIARFLIQATGDPDAATFKLKAQKNGSGGYTDVAVGASGDPEIYIATSANISASAADETVQRLTGGTGDFVAGRIADDVNQLPSIGIDEDGNTELAWCLTMDAPAAHGDYWDLRVYAGDTPLDTYSQTARITVESEGEEGAGAVTLSALLLSGTGAVSRTSSGDILLPEILVSASSERSIAGSGAIALPEALVSGTAERTSEGAADIVLPELLVSGTGAVQSGHYPPMSVLGTWSDLTAGDSATPGAMSIANVPEGTQLAIVFVRWASLSGAAELVGLSSTFGDVTILHSTDKSGPSIALAYVEVDDDGPSHTLTPEWSTAPVSRCVFGVVFIDGVDLSSEGSWLRDWDYELEPRYGLPDEPFVTEVDSTESDLVLGASTYWWDPPPDPPAGTTTLIAPFGSDANDQRVVSVDTPGAETTEVYVYGGGNNLVPVMSIILASGGSEGDIALPTLSVSGTGAVQRNSVADIALPTLSVSGTGAVQRNSVADIALPLLQLAGAGEVSSSADGDGDIALPLLQVSGVAQRVVLGSSAIALPSTEIAGTGSVTGAAMGDGDLTLPPLQISGAGITSRDGAGSISLPLMQVSGVGSSHDGQMTGAGDLMLPTLQITGSGYRSIDGSGAISLPELMVSGARHAQIEVGVTRLTGVLSYVIPLSAVHR